MSLEAVLGRLNTAVMLLDEAGSVTFANSATALLLGGTPNTFHEAFPREDWSHLLDRMHRDVQHVTMTRANGDNFDVTLTLIENDPTQIVAELAAANDLGLPGENMLMRTQRRLELAQEAGGSAYFEYVPGWNRFVTSSFGARMVGSTQTSYTLGDVLQFLGDPAYEDELARRFNHAIDTQGSFEMEVPVNHEATRETRWILIRGEMLPDPDHPENSSMLGTLQDVTDRKRFDLELSASRALLAEAESLLQGFSFEWDLTSNRWSVSPNFYRLLEIAEVKPTRKLLIGLVVPDDRSRVLNTMRSALRKGSEFRVEHAMRTGTGNVRHFQLVGKALTDEQGRFVRVVGASSDITELKEAQRALRESEAKFRAFMEAFPGFVFIKDNNHVYRFASASHAFRPAPGQPPVPGQAVDLYGPELAAVIEQQEQEVLATGEPQTVLRRLDDAEGRSRYLEVNIFPIRLEGQTLLGGYVTDETASRQSDEEKERLTSAVEHSGEMIVITDIEGTIEYVNPVFERIMGFSREEVIGGHNKIWRSGLHDQSFYDEAWERIQQGSTWQGTLINKRKDGSLIHEETTISQVRDRNGNVTGYVEVKRDVTRQRELEQQLAQSQKLESIGTLAGGVAHDYNNVLQTILGNTELLLDQFGGNAELAELAEEIKSAAEQSASLTSQLLAFARKQVVVPRAANLNAEFGSLKNMLQRLIGANIELRFEPQQDLWNIRIDPSQVRQVLTNILVNARDAISDVGEIVVRTSNVPRELGEVLPTGARPDRDFVRIDITDNGCGMSEDEQARAFEPFFTTKPMNEGTGLGLATVYGIVKQNEGYVFCESAPDIGTTMTLLLPRHLGAVEAGDAPKSDTSGLGPVGKQVLIVEDDQAILKLMERALTLAGYDVIATGGPKAALEAVASGERPDLLLTDVIMPGKNGLDLFSEIRELQPDLRVIFMSGYSADVLEGIDFEPEFVQKPFRKADLIERVSRVLED